MNKYQFITLLTIIINSEITFSFPVDNVEPPINIRLNPCGIVAEVVNSANSKLPPKKVFDVPSNFFNFINLTVDNLAYVKHINLGNQTLSLTHKYPFLRSLPVKQKKTKTAIGKINLIKWHADIQIYVGALQTLTKYKSSTDKLLHKELELLKQHARHVLCELQTLLVSRNQPIRIFTDLEIDKLINFDNSTDLKLSTDIEIDETFNINFMDSFITKTRFINYVKSIKSILLEKRTRKRKTNKGAKKIRKPSAAAAAAAAKGKGKGKKTAQVPGGKNKKVIKKPIKKIIST